MGRLGLSRPKQDGAQKGPTFCARGDRVLRGAVPMTKLLGTTAGAAWEATGGHAPEPTPRALCPRPREPSYGPSDTSPVPTRPKTRLPLRQVVANNVTVEPISRIAHLLAGAAWIFAEILIIPPEQISCSAFGTGLQWTLNHCRGHEEAAYRVTALRIPRFAVHSEASRPPGQVKDASAGLYVEAERPRRSKRRARRLRRCSVSGRR